MFDIDNYIKNFEIYFTDYESNELSLIDISFIKDQNQLNQH
jgi:hypothetical protein